MATKLAALTATARRNMMSKAVSRRESLDGVRVPLGVSNIFPHKPESTLPSISLLYVGKQPYESCITRSKALNFFGAFVVFSRHIKYKLAWKPVQHSRDVEVNILVIVLNKLGFYSLRWHPSNYSPTCTSSCVLVYTAFRLEQVKRLETS